MRGRDPQELVEVEGREAREVDVVRARSAPRAPDRRPPASCRSAVRARDPAWCGSHRRPGGPGRGPRRGRSDRRAGERERYRPSRTFVDGNPRTAARLPAARARPRRRRARGSRSSVRLAWRGPRQPAFELLAQPRHGAEDPAREHEREASPIRPRRRATLRPDASSSLAAPRRMPMAAASPSRNADSTELRQRTDCRWPQIAGNRPRAATLCAASIPKCCSSSGVKRRLRTALVGFAQHRTQRGTADPVAAALVTEHIAPAAGPGRFPARVASVGDRTRARDDHHAGLAGRARLERNQSVVHDQHSGLEPDPAHDAAHRRRVTRPVDAGNAQADRGRD